MASATLACFEIQVPPPRCVAINGQQQTEYVDTISTGSVAALARGRHMRLVARAAPFKVLNLSDNSSYAAVPETHASGLYVLTNSFCRTRLSD